MFSIRISFLHKFLCTTMASQVMGGTRAAHVFSMLVLISFFVIAAEGAIEEYAPMKILMDEWDIRPPSWVGSDPCVGGWAGIECTDSRITSIALADMALTGQLPSDIGLLSELESLNLSFNKGLKGLIPASIGKLTKLVYLNLVGCSFFGRIPDTIGSLQQLSYLSLKNNSFDGLIPPSIGNLSNLSFLDISDNKLVGSLPVSNRTTPGLDKLYKARHFHFQNNQLSGTIPSQLFSSQMVLIHVIFDRNNLTGSIPSTLGLVQTLQALRLDRNSLSGSVPSSLNNLSKIAELHLSNNQLTGPVPNLTSLNGLSYVDLSNNTFDVSDIPTWFSTLQNLTTLMMENTRLQGEVPQALFSNDNLETVVLRNNKINGLLDLETISSSNHLLIDMEKNFITDLSAGGSNSTLKLADNPICEGTNMTNNYCIVSLSNSSNLILPSNCASVACSPDQVSSPNCTCAYPYTGTLVFIFVSFSNLGNSRYYTTLQDSLVTTFQSYNLPVESVSLGYPTWGSSYQLELFIQVFPSGQDRFNQTGASAIASVISNQTLPQRPPFFGPYSAVLTYGNSGGGGSKKGLTIGAAVGGSVLLLLLALVGVYALQQKRRADKQWSRSIPLSGISNSSASAPRLKGARLFSFEELQKYTNGFSEANDVGAGGYGKVYRGILPTGQMVAIKRAKRDSMQGGPEFTAEVELLSRVHHKNLVSLVGFCLEQGEQILVYEYVPNGDLLDSLSGKSGIRLDWLKRLKIILGAARGLAYLHELANPPIIHRDIKSNNILLDKDLTAKVADFGLSKSMADSGTDHVTTQVKGTMGYLDPEYYMTQQLTEKSDVYSFGVVMLELITARRPIEQGKYIVRVVQMAMDKTKDLYNLQEVLDPYIGLGTELKGLEIFVDLAMSCVEESQDKRPRMGEVVKVIEKITQLAALNNSTSSSASYEDVSRDDLLPSAQRSRP
ncbi:probable leucine-rich repeat receptor-like protein kinase At5g49770 [Prunus avium]|uniref:non-specific serine/threonine protein kinase n=1 Tax=Prunus avium TaxID=42229 RepID=A0A6P5SQ02_PRUAV|nr:probable leucine-rich repeat receptor-like protein kinase At5g49770 [Prunus avium]